MTRTLLFALPVCIIALALPGRPSHAQDHATRILNRADKDGDGRIRLEEWSRPSVVFKSIDTDGDGYLTREELRARFDGPSNEAPKSPTATDRGGGDGKAAMAGGGLLKGQVTADAVDHETRCAIGRGRGCDIELSIKRGLFETGLRPAFPDNAKCRDIDERWAINYSSKRERESYHGGIDMPAPFGTPIVAAAAGTVVGKYRDERGHRGIEIVLRHGPDDTGIPLWIYTQYAHFEEMPKQEIGQRVRMGEVLGPTGNSGRTPGQRSGKQRRPAIHFAVWYSSSPRYVALSTAIVPLDGYWMDPNALYRKTPPFDSRAMKALPAREKDVPISVMFDDGTLSPPATKIIWPYICAKR
jgi:murein DD-endopeptidase MepM/ murein hydrolase activator NlpD